MQPGEDTPTEALLDGRYELGECIGEGGMARVHRGYDHALGRAVAIKVMRAGVEDASGLGRARGEMLVLASLSHPSLVTLYDARVVTGSTSYLVMELVDGPTLSTWLDGGALPERDAALLGLDLAEALHVVHGAGIVHRDVKPSNVLLSPTDLPGRTYRARLADFGIAYLVDSTRLTSPGTVVGTAAFLAPEQVKGAPPAPPADIYALGLLLLEAMTGERAFAPAAGVESLVTRLHVAPTVPDSLGSAWQKLLVSMTALEPAERPTALEVASTISALIATGPQTVRTQVLSAAAAPVDDITQLDSAPTELAPLLTAADTPPVPPLPTVAASVPSVRARNRARRPRRRRGLVVGASVVAASGAVALGLWFAADGAGFPAPVPSVAAVTEPTLESPSPASDETSTAGTETDPVDVPVEEVSTPVVETIDAPVTAPVETETDEVVPEVVAPATPTGNDAPEVDREAEKTAQEVAKAAEKAQKDAEKAQKAEEKSAKDGE